MTDKTSIIFIIFVFIIGYLLSFGYGAKYGEQRMVNILCKKYKYDFCEEIKNETIYVLKEDFLNGDN